MKYLSKYKYYIKLYEDINWEEDWEEEEPNELPIGESMEFYKQYVGRKVILRSKNTYQSLQPLIGVIEDITNRLSNVYFIHVRWNKKLGKYLSSISNYKPNELILID